MTFVPLPVAAVAGTVRVQRGETLAGLCSRLGQPLHAYRELVGANLHYPMTGDGVPAGCSVVFSDLSEGDELYVPASWQPRGSHLGGLEGAPGMLGDGTSDAMAVFFPYNPQSGLSKEHWADNIAVLSAWWRDDHKNGAAPASIADVAPYSQAAVSWWKNVGSKLTPGVARNIPFGQFPLNRLLAAAKSGLPIARLVNADKLNATLQALVKPGQFPQKAEKNNWKLATDGTFQTIEASGFMPVDWKGLANGIRWDLLPLDQILERVAAGKTKWTGDMTDWLIGEVKALTGQPAASGDIQIDLLSCGPGKISVAGKCYGYAGPANPLTGCPAGSVQYMGHCIQTDCKPGDTAEITPAGVVCTPPGGGVPPTDKPCPPQGVKKPDGSCDCKEKMGPTAELDDKLWLCVDCGPNATHKPGTTDCDCLPGYVPHPSGAEGSGCVQKGGPGGGTDNKAIEKPSAGGWSTGEKAIAALVGVAAAFGLAKAAKVI
jgi:hypothetical protein